ncbi:hypothetical protein CDAR_534971 [Caerostris darwini]|uniref:C2H2-type domain-containing protein n=1 Tax=Caerostris darwini TaxID=1538125 RepID=A0AAV4QIY3_9ARAC|nr:hypothetical protein CDAR_534971 [Caerostris darwini]
MIHPKRFQFKSAYFSVFVDFGTDLQFFRGEDKRYLCPVCDYSSLALTNVKRHVLTHTGVYPYKCTLCGKGFRQKRDLDSHRMKHSGERPFKCHVCPKSFTRKEVLKTHMISHFRNDSLS